MGKLSDFLETQIPAPFTYLVIGILLLLLFVSIFTRRLRFTSKGQLQLAQQNMLVSALTEVQELAVLVDSRGNILFINPASERLLRIKIRAVRGKPVSQLFTLFDASTKTPLPWLEQANAKQHERLDIPQALLGAGSLMDLPVSCSVQTLQFDENDQLFYMLLMRDQTEIQELQVRLEYIGLHDSHTSLLNRKGFEIRLKLAIDQVRQHGIKHSFCLISMDQFKLINDTMGHTGGDELIKRIAKLLKARIDPKRDVLARLGGDEFGILLQEVEPTVALKNVESIFKALYGYAFQWNEMEQKVTASVAFVPLYKALVTSNNRNASVNRVLSVADNACRVAKSKGGAKIHIYRPNDQEVMKQKGNMEWLGRLKKAFEAGNFRLVAQPIHPLHPKLFQMAYHHYEILIRLYDEADKPIPPDEFIPAAEYYSMMPRLDRWVVHNLVTTLREVTQRVPCPVFAVNLSGQSLDEPDFLSFVLAEIREAGINPGMLCFEITERVAIHNIALAQKFIETLKGLGCSFSLDDFGTGVSSFSYLKSLPVDYLKIDGSFIKDIANDPVAEAMVRSINQVGHVMGVKVIAEYVENDSVIQFVRELGVDYGQGYGISKPIPLENVIKQHIL